MKESINITVVDPDDDNEMEVEILFEDDVITFKDCDRDKVLFRADWSENLAPIFERALSIWSPTDKDK